MSKYKPHITPEMLKAYADGSLNSVDRYAVERAALRDETVREVLESYEQLKEQQTDLPTINNRLKNRLQKRIEKPEKKLIIGWWKYGLAASVLLGIFVSSYLIFNNLDHNNLALETSPVEVQKQPPSPQIEQSYDEKIAEEKPKQLTANIGTIQKKNSTIESKSVEQVQAANTPIFENETSGVLAQAVDKEALTEKAIEPTAKEVKPIPNTKLEEVAPARSAKRLVESTIQNVVLGKVIDQQGEPLPGVTVSVKDKSIGTATDVNGEFELKNISPSDTIQLSYIGFKGKEIKAKDIDKSIILSEDSAVLSEIVVTGYSNETQNQMASPVMSWKIFRKNLEVKGDKKGNVTLLLTISANGEVIKKEIKKGLGEPYDSQALNLSVFNESWNPAYKNGEAVEEKIRVIVRFKNN